MHIPRPGDRNRFAGEKKAAVEGTAERDAGVRVSGPWRGIGAVSEVVLIPAGAGTRPEGVADRRPENTGESLDGELLDGAFADLLEAERQVAVEVAGDAVPPRRPDLDVHGVVAVTRHRRQERRAGETGDVAGEFQPQFQRAGHRERLDRPPLPVGEPRREGERLVPQ